MRSAAPGRVFGSAVEAASLGPVHSCTHESGAGRRRVGGDEFVLALINADAHLATQILARIGTAIAA